MLKDMVLDTGVELTILESTGVYDYSWSEAAVMRGSDGLLYVGSTSGCSCNYFNENLCDDEVEQVKSWQDAATWAKEWAEHRGDSDEKAGAMSLIEALVRDEPLAFDPSAVTVEGEVCK